MTQKSRNPSESQRGRRRLIHAPARGLHLSGVKAMSTVSAPRPPVKPRSRPQRFARLDARPAVDEPAVLTLHVADKETDYWLYVQPSDVGEAFRLEKLIPTEDGPAERGEVYQVCFQDQHNQTCECKGFLRHGHCKHLDSLKAL